LRALFLFVSSGSLPLLHAADSDPDSLSAALGELQLRSAESAVMVPLLRALVSVRPRDQPSINVAQEAIAAVDVISLPFVWQSADGKDADADVDGEANPSVEGARAGVGNSSSCGSSGILSSSARASVGVSYISAHVRLAATGRFDLIPYAKLERYSPRPGDDMTVTLLRLLQCSAAAAVAPDPKLALLLLAKGADPSAADRYGRSCLLILADGAHFPLLLQCLRAAAAGPSAVAVAVQRDHAGRTLRAAIETGPHADNPRARDCAAVAKELEWLWWRRARPAIARWLAQTAGVAADAAGICLDYVDGGAPRGGDGDRACR
jgi:hypothetical protein